MPSHVIIAGDCQLLQPHALPDNAVMICDPPYSPHVHAAMTSAVGTQVGVRTRDAGFGALTDDLRDHIARLGAACRWSVVFSDWEGLGAWREAFNAQPNYRYVRVVPWIRWSMPQLSGDRPPSGSEAIVIAGTAGTLRWSGPGNLTHFDELCERGADKHPTAKPLDLMLRLVEYFSEPGELIVDPVCGRGTTVLAAKILGRGGLGIDNGEIAGEPERARARLEAPLSERDAERLARYRARTHDGVADAERRKALCDKSKARAAARKAGA
jgi:hypothetical protein